MTLLPIVQRELRVAARKSSTYRARMGFAFITSLFAIGLLLWNQPVAARGGGNSVFAFLTSMAFGYCLLAGVRHAADCLSEEIREGTLGLLFLTDLKGYDIVAGKLAAISIKTFQNLFAFFPILAIGILLGGITAGEFWRMTAVLSSTLFLSLCAGLWISSQSRSAHRALAGTLILLTLVTILPLAIDSIAPIRWFGSVGEYISYFSPITAAMRAWDTGYQFGRSSFWCSLLISHALGWCLLFRACASLPQAWQDRPSKPVMLEFDSPGSSILAVRRLRQRRLLEKSPIFWLVLRDGRQRLVLILFATGCVTTGIVALLVGPWLGGAILGVTTVLNMGLTIVLKLWVAWQAGATLAEARRNGAVELLLATSLGTDEIIRGHWYALKRMFGWAVLGALIVRALPELTFLLFGPTAQSRFYLISAPFLTLFGMATLVLDLVAIAWVGMWMGISQSKPVQAFARTVLLTILIPMVLFCLPNFVLDLVWIQWSRRKLALGFRNAAADRFAPLPATQNRDYGSSRSASLPPIIPG